MANAPVREQMPRTTAAGNRPKYEGFRTISVEKGTLLNGLDEVGRYLGEGYEMMDDSNPRYAILGLPLEEAARRDKHTIDEANRRLKPRKSEGLVDNDVTAEESTLTVGGRSVATGEQ